MRDISSAVLREEISRLGILLCDTEVFHPSGVRLHGFGDALGIVHANQLYALGISTLFLLDPGEDQKTAMAGLLPDDTVPAFLATGDVPSEDVRSEDGRTLAQAGKPLTADDLLRLRAAVPKAVVRRSRPEDCSAPAQRYLQETGAAEPDPTRPDTRVLRAARQRSREIWTYFVPRARILVALESDFDRSLASNTLRGAGHEILESSPGREGVDLCREAKPDIVLVDLAQAESFAFALRAGQAKLDPVVFAATPDPKATEIARVLDAGVNAVVPKPLVPDALVERMRSGLLLLNRTFRFPPLVLRERRASGRRPLRGDVALRYGGTAAAALPLTAAALREWGPSGAVIEYNRPKKALAWAYTPHGVHPSHFFYRHFVRAADSVPLEVVVTPAGRSSVGAPARVAWVRPTPDGECAGLVLGAKS